jgi:hypothetical protein
MLLWRLTSINLEDRGAPARRRREEAGAERMAGEEIGIETDAPGAGLDHPDHSAIGEVQSSARRSAALSCKRAACMFSSR